MEYLQGHWMEREVHLGHVVLGFPRVLLDLFSLLFFFLDTRALRATPATLYIIVVQ